jgi:hypothetical protein
MVLGAVALGGTVAYETRSDELAIKMKIKPKVRAKVLAAIGKRARDV